MSTIEVDDLIFYKTEKGEIYSGGFNVNSMILKQGLSPIVTLNSDIQTGGVNQVSDLFQHIVVPNWIFAFPMKRGGSKNVTQHLPEEDDTNDYDDDDDDYDDDDDDDDDADVTNATNDEVIEDDIHNKLLSLVTVDQKEIKNNKKQTKKRLFSLKHKNNQTKRKSQKK